MLVENGRRAYSLLRKYSCRVCRLLFEVAKNIFAVAARRTDGRPVFPVSVRQAFGHAEGLSCKLEVHEDLQT